MKEPTNSNVDVILFDPASEDILLKTEVLNGINYKIYDPIIDIKFDFHSIFNALFYCFRFKSSMVFKGFYSITILKELVREYRAQVVANNIRFLNPKLVLTWIDNSTIFHMACNACNDIPFLAIANSARTLWCMTEAVPSAQLKYHVDEYFCYGPRMKRMFEDHGHDIKKYVTSGSLVGGYFFDSAIKKTQIDDQVYDVCLISQWIDFEATDPVWINSSLFYGFLKARESMELYLARYANERQIKVCVALRGKPGEKTYYDDIFGENCTMQENDRESFSSYEAASVANLILSHNSSLAVEMFAAGRKVLFTPSSAMFQQTDSIGCWHLSNPSYEVFSERVDDLLQMNVKGYQLQAKAEMENIMTYNPKRPPHKIIRERLLELISE